MLDPLQSSMRVAGAGLRAQAVRIQIVSENIANSHTTAQGPGEDPFRRKTVTFGDEVARTEGARYVVSRTKSIGGDASPFGSFATRASGCEREGRSQNAERRSDTRGRRSAGSQSAKQGLQVVKQARDLFSMTVDLLRT